MLSSYQQRLQSGELTVDVIQERAVDELVKRQQALKNNVSLRGLYLHGRVGRGKTLLMDMFFDTLSTKRKIRLHFHHFMYLLHQKLNAIQGQVNPLEQVASELAKQVDVVCFDEFFVNDIADAMLLGGVFNALHKHNIMIVTTSNTAPDNLYEGGLARDRFTPTITLIKAHLTYFSLDGDVDYRTTFTKYNPLYFVNDKPAFDQERHRLAIEENHQSITILSRDIATRGKSNNVLWFDFMTLCDGPRSQNDYIHLADSYDIILISDVVQLGGKIVIDLMVKGTEDGDTNYLITPASPVEIGHLDDCARRLIALVDEFYDRHKLLIIDADCALEALYQGGRVVKAFERTVSRLTEMQSIDYQAKVGGEQQSHSLSLINAL
jgi:cell division protein ZapE